MSERDAQLRPSSLVEGILQRELLPWSLLGLTVGLVEGATVAVLIKKTFIGSAAQFWVNLAVAMVSGAPSLANLSSFIWANLAHGRERVVLVVQLQCAFALVVGLIALIPANHLGLLFTLIAVIAARVLWTGILTVRSAIWSANYPRHLMARVTSRIVIVGSMGVAIVSLIVGWMIDARLADPRWLYALAAAAGLCGAWRYRAVRVRREYQLLAAEAEHSSGDGALGLAAFRRILKQDGEYRRFMFWMSLYGAGNLMVNALLVILLTDRLQIAGLTQILLLAVIPLAMMPLTIGWWAQLFDQGHVIEYRARQCWVLVASIAILSIGVWTGQEWLLWVGAVLNGAGYAGASLGWSLGHNDFASLGQAQHYMGVHVTLTGVRGLIAPPLGVLCYTGLELLRPGAGIWVMLLPLALAAAGGYGFVRMRRMRAAGR